MKTYVITTETDETVEIHAVLIGPADPDNFLQQWQKEVLEPHCGPEPDAPKELGPFDATKYQENWLDLHCEWANKVEAFLNGKPYAAVFAEWLCNGRGFRRVDYSTKNYAI